MSSWLSVILIALLIADLVTNVKLVRVMKRDVRELHEAVDRYTEARSKTTPHAVEDEDLF